MITKLNNKNKNCSSEIYTVFQLSYKVEAEILKAVDFPPLKRTITDFTNSDTQFFGYHVDNKLSGIIELKTEGEATHIQSLVVCPSNFRQGIASKLIEFSLNTLKSKLFTVETGLQNIPAIKLYKQFGFTETKQWDTNHGIRKVELKLNF